MPFQALRDFSNGYTKTMLAKNFRYLPCPCCGFPSITTMIAMTCSICWWEADGPIDSEDEPRSVNHGYSLRQARANFVDHGHMYDLGREISYLIEESTERTALLDYVRQVQLGQAEFSQSTLIELIRAEDEHMRSAADEARVSDADEEAMLRALMEARGRTS